jgi:hypothetical protein
MYLLFFSAVYNLLASKHALILSGKKLGLMVLMIYICRHTIIQQQQQ